MYKALTLISFVILQVSFLPTFAQKEDPTAWSVSVSKTTVKAGETVELIFKAEIKDGWYLYSSDFDKDLGPVVAELNFNPNETYELIGEVKPVGAKSKTDTLIWMGTYTYFMHHAEFRQKVKILKNNPSIKVKFNGQACNDGTGKCVPVIKQFTFNDIKVVEGNPQPKGNEKPDKTSVATNKKPKEPANKNTAQKETPETDNHETLNPSDFPDRLSYLKAEKERLIQKKPDNVISELKDFVAKYGK
jgi:thiol:disulfide interchange protein DsbD